MTTTRKVCGHVFNGGCNYGGKCNNYHPVDPEGAKKTYEAMTIKSLNLCGFYPQCKRLDCTYLHVEVHEKPGASAPAAGPRAPPKSTTPARPGRAAAKIGGATRGRGRGGGQSRNVDSAAHIQSLDAGASFELLSHISEGISTIDAVSRTGASVELTSAAAGMLINIRNALSQIDGAVEAYKLALTTPAEDAPGDGSEGDDE
jgi:hypothetical protein